MRNQIATTLRARLRGLLGHDDFTAALLLAPCNDVHTLGMKRPIDIAFVDEDGIVIESHRAIGPGKRRRCKGAAATIERFANETPWFVKGDILEITVQKGRLPFCTVMSPRPCVATTKRRNDENLSDLRCACV